MDARRRGDIRATSDASMWYGNQYGEAFSRLGGDEAAAVAAEYLEDRAFGLDASLILKAISDTQLNLPEPSFHRQWPRRGGKAKPAVAEPKVEAASKHHPLKKYLGLVG
jgi:hypothetical protein